MKVNEYRSFKRNFCCFRYVPATLNDATPKQSSLCNKQHKYKVHLHSTRCRGSRGIAPRILSFKGNCSVNDKPFSCPEIQSCEREI